MADHSPKGWEEFLELHPQAHVLQTGAWGRLKSAFGWQPVQIQVGLAGAQVLFRRLPGGFHVAYIPRGPLGKDWSVLWPRIDELCRKKRAIFMKVEPDCWEGEDPDLEKKLPDFQPGDAIQPPRTLVVDIFGDEETILNAMKQKTRYNIRLAEKKEVSVRETADVRAFHQLMIETGQRDGFGVHSQAYYQTAYDAFSPGGNCALLLAEYQGKPLAGLMVFCRGERAWYFYGASNNEERNRMPTYLLQWRAIQWAKAQGCTSYDLWGVPDQDEETLERLFESRSDGLWGVYRFKRGFGGQLKRSVGAWDKIYLPGMYRLYRLYRRLRGGGNE